MDQTQINGYNPIPAPLKAVMRARRVGGPALRAELSLTSSAKTHAARRHAKGMICVWVGSVFAAVQRRVAVPDRKSGVL